MSKHAYLTIPIAIALLIVCPSLTRAQAQPAITVQFQDASLAQVAQAFASLSGLTIVVAADVSDLKVTTAVKNVEWPRALGQIPKRMTWSHASMLRAPSVSKGARHLKPLAAGWCLGSSKPKAPSRGSGLTSA